VEETITALAQPPEDTKAGQPMADKEREKEALGFRAKIKRKSIRNYFLERCVGGPKKQRLLAYNKTFFNQ
jgi:hypothetical protein